MMNWLGRRGLALLLAVSAVSPLAAHETDQYTLPRGREFAEVGDYFTQWTYEVIERAVEKTNRQIRLSLDAKEGDAALQELQSPEHIADSVNHELPWAMDVIEGFERWVDRPETKRKYPGRVVGYKEQFTNIYQHVHFPLDPRQFFRLFLGSTMKVYGVYLGTDKIGHFTDMGMNYYRQYRRSLRDGKSEEQAVRDAINVGTHGLIFSERGMLGYLSAGAYSNGDLAANYLGFLFYKNLTDPVMLKDQLRPPMLQREGPYWKMADHVRRDSEFFSFFFSDHFNEVLNPSLFETGMRHSVREAVKKRTDAILERYCDEKGVSRSPAYFQQRAQELSTYYGVDYGHQGNLDELVTIGNTCFPQSSNAATPSSRKPMYMAALEDTIKPDAEDLNGQTPLHLMAADPQAPSVTLLLQKGADPNARNHHQQTPLHCALEAGNTPAAAELLQRGADAKARDQFNITPLHLAATRSDSALVSLMLGQGIDISAKDDFGRTPLHEAARAGREQNVALLLQAGADPNATDAYGSTPLHLACRSSRVLVVRILQQQGAKLDAQSSSGTTPLHEAALAGDKGIVRLLLAAGANPNLRNRKGQTPRDVAASCSSRSHSDIGDILRQAVRQKP